MASVDDEIAALEAKLASLKAAKKAKAAARTMAAAPVDRAQLGKVNARFMGYVQSSVTLARARALPPPVWLGALCNPSRRDQPCTV